jgi:[ribosomal protein S18]-alanine N-acetyltransferase
MATAHLAISSGVSISEMTEHDLIEVVEIEGKCGLSKWGWAAYYAELQSGNRRLMLVARSLDERHDRLVTGYVVARLAANELHINNIAVRPEYRRQRVGTDLLTCILSEGLQKGATAAFLEVRAGNRSAQALYQECGFRTVGRRRNYYSNPTEDALIMSVPLEHDA